MSSYHYFFRRVLKTLYSTGSEGHHTLAESGGLKNKMPHSRNASLIIAVHMFDFHLLDGSLMYLSIHFHYLLTTGWSAVEIISRMWRKTRGRNRGLESDAPRLWMCLPLSLPDRLVRFHEDKAVFIENKERQLEIKLLRKRIWNFYSFCVPMLALVRIMKARLGTTETGFVAFITWLPCRMVVVFRTSVCGASSYSLRWG